MNDTNLSIGNRPDANRGCSSEELFASVLFVEVGTGMIDRFQIIAATATLCTNNRFVGWLCWRMFACKDPARKERWVWLVLRTVDLLMLPRRYPLELGVAVGLPTFLLMVGLIVEFLL